MSDTFYKLVANLNAIGAIANDLPNIGKRSQLKTKAEQIFVLLESAQQHAIALNNEALGKDAISPGVRFARPKDARK
ncbi:hypothetical protein SAMN05216420_101337 [Nitrosospira sp. Nl5]|uniref:hypothetical protein n=1 Tax=Nitrosospira sp. Nl5 TaxID=200120 RepID=UPI00088D167D|nr:hypothetical protein [Nitrosospira sp. Nl5]SCX92047.1 hypothetical protein SAMN05216420_101337 [Nitrosospira sp. Nl5]